ncbi:MAG: hypothetical protein QXF77_09690, partial [Candidatus Jordarchaeales archaeon]
IRFVDGLLLNDRACRTYFSKRGERTLVELEVVEEEDIVEVDFSSLVNRYVKFAEGKKASFSAEKVVDCFFMMLENGGRVEDYLKRVDYDDERELLEAMYRISMVIMRLKGKDVTAKVTYPSFSGEN